MEMVDEMGTVDVIPIYYCGDYDGLWDHECDDIGYTGNFDGQSESSDYEDPRDFYRDEWIFCGSNACGLMLLTAGLLPLYSDCVLVCMRLLWVS